VLNDENYQIKNFSRDKVRVLLRLDAPKVHMTVKGVRRTDGDYEAPGEATAKRLGLESQLRTPGRLKKSDKDRQKGPRKLLAMKTVDLRSYDSRPAG
jgi:hypothetical protein